MAHDVFVSHSTRDKVVADACCARLESERVRCWIAPRDIPPGSSWPAEIDRAIASCRVLVVIFSANANDSEPVKKEATLALNYGKPIIPLRIESVRPTGSLSFLLSDTHWLDAVDPPLDRRLHELASLVCQMLGADPPERPVPDTPRPVVRRFPWAMVGGITLAGAITAAMMLRNGNRAEDSGVTPAPSRSAAGTSTKTRSPESGAAAFVPVSSGVSLNPVMLDRLRPGLSRELTYASVMQWNKNGADALAWQPLTWHLVVAPGATQTGSLDLVWQEAGPELNPGGPEALLEALPVIQGLAVSYTEARSALLQAGGFLSPGQLPVAILSMQSVDDVSRPVWMIRYEFPDGIRRYVRADTGALVYQPRRSAPELTEKKPELSEP